MENDEYKYSDYDKNNENIIVYESYMNNGTYPIDNTYYANYLLVIILVIFGSYCCNSVIKEIKKNINECRIEHNLLEKINNNEIDGYSCPICLEEFKESKNIRKLKCKHIFHKNCIKEWLEKENTCPNCRKNII